VDNVQRERFEERVEQCKKRIRRLTSRLNPVTLLMEVARATPERAS